MKGHPIDRPEQAVRAFRDDGFNCAQAVLSTYAAELGLSRAAALRLAAPFGSGMACRGETCGAVTGALMVLGLAHGNERGDDEAGQARSYALAERFLDRFRALHGTIRCRDVLGCDVSTPEGRAAAREQRLYEERCPICVRDAARILDTLLAEEIHARG